MPVKKKSTKKSAKTTKKTKQEKIDKNRIRRAVEKLPGLIIERTKTEQHEKIDTTAKPIMDEPEEKVIAVNKPYSRPNVKYDDGSDKKWLMWLGVIIFVIAIFSLWAWNIIVKFQDIADTNQLNIIEDVKQDLKSALDTPLTNDELTEEKIEITDNDDIKDKIKKNLAKIITNLNNATSTEPDETKLIESVGDENFGPEEDINLSL